MFQKALREIAPRVSGQRAWNQVAGVARHHRIQASPGFRAAARQVLDALAQGGTAAEILAYPADGKSGYWTQTLFKEWHGEAAELWLTEPTAERRRLALFSEQPISLIQRSCATPPGGVAGELMVLGGDPAGWDALDLTGKFVLVGTEGFERALERAVKPNPPLGVITDRMMEQPLVRSRMDVPDALQYSSFWWTADGPRALGFVVSPREGDRLRKLCQTMATAADGPRAPRLHAEVSAREYSGEIEVVSAVIPGMSDEEVVLVAHLCHPNASANDNASGCGVLLEVAEVLSELIREHKLPKPQRSIRLLWLAEYTGTYAYLASREAELGKLVAALNLDMVGENQDLCKSVLNVERPPRAMASFTADLLARIVGAVGDEVRNLAGSASYPLFRWAATPHSGGSDHDIFADPTVGVPCPMLIQWPDKYYHTSQDTLDKVDPEMLRRVATATATYAWFIATAGYAEAVWLANELAAAFPAELHAAGLPLEAALADAADLTPDAAAALVATTLAAVDRKQAFLLDRRLADIGSLARLVPTAMSEAFAGVCTSLRDEMLIVLTTAQCRLRTTTRVALNSRHICELPPPACARSAVDDAAALVIAKRLYRGPLEMRSIQARLTAEERAEWEQFQREHPQSRTLANNALYWTDGARTAVAVADLVELDTGRRDTAFLLGLYDFLAGLGLVKLTYLGEVEDA